MKVILESEIKEIQNLITSAKKLVDDELKSHFAKYLCVRASGHMENTIKYLIENFHTKTCKPHTKNYIDSTFSKVTNLDNDRLLKILKTFSPDWEKAYSDQMNDEYIASLDSVVHLRNNIAHGKSLSVGVTIDNISNHFNNIKEVSKILHKVIKK